MVDTLYDLLSVTLGVRIPVVASIFRAQALGRLNPRDEVRDYARDQPGAAELILGSPQDYPVSRADPASAPRIICSPRDAHRYWAR